MNFYKHHLGDFDAATAHLSWDERAAYLYLLQTYYRNEAPIPADIAQACRLVRARTAAHKASVNAVLNEFFTLQADGWHSKRCDEEIAKYRAQATTNKRIANERFVNDSSTNRSPNQEPDTKNQIPEPETTTSKATTTPPRANGRAPVVAPELPDWLPTEPWKAWLEMRKRKGAPATPEALKIAMRKLAKFKAGGHDPKTILEESTYRGWTGLFEPKPEDVKKKSLSELLDEEEARLQSTSRH